MVGLDPECIMINEFTDRWPIWICDMSLYKNLQYCRSIIAMGLINFGVHPHVVMLAVTEETL